MLSGLLLVYAGLPWLSPLLRALGFERLGLTLFTMYSTLCHQLPERSFFLSRYQVCYCHRCTALYTSLLVVSLLYSVKRWRHGISHRIALLLTLPMVVDGSWHMLDDLLPLVLRSADDTPGSLNFWLRMATGMLFGVGVILWAYPRLNREIEQFDLKNKA